METTKHTQGPTGGPVDLDEVDRLCESVTPGPWVQDQDPDGDESGITGWLPSSDVNAVSQSPDGDLDVDFLLTAMIPANAAFIAWCREGVPRMAAELRAARERESRIRVLLDASPYGPTRADLAILVTEIRQIVVGGGS